MAGRDLISFNIEESDLEQTLYYTRDTVKFAFMPLVDHILGARPLSENRPIRIGLAGPPGSGKSSIASTLRLLLEEKCASTLVLPLDGFHKTNSTLMSSTVERGGRLFTLYELKGSSASYDTDAFMKTVSGMRNGKNFSWPVYSRTLHEPVQDAIKPSGEEAVYIVEGNYLLLDKSPWNGLHDFFDVRIFIMSNARTLKRGLIRRKMRGGYDAKETKIHYRRCDRENIREVLRFSKIYDFSLYRKRPFRYDLAGPLHS